MYTQGKKYQPHLIETIVNESRAAVWDDFTEVFTNLTSTSRLSTSTEY